MDIEIGRGKRARRAYTFDDIAVVPSRRTRDPNSSPRGPAHGSSGRRVRGGAQPMRRGRGSCGVISPPRRANEISSSPRRCCRFRRDASRCVAGRKRSPCCCFVRRRMRSQFTNRAMARASAWARSAMTPARWKSWRRGSATASWPSIRAGLRPMHSPRCSTAGVPRMMPVSAGARGNLRCAVPA